MEEYEVKRKVAATHLRWKLRADDTEVVAQIDEKGKKLAQQPTL